MPDPVTTQISGTVNIRPVLLGVVLETDSEEAVFDVQRRLARAWGGCFSTLISQTMDPNELEWRFRAYNLDALCLWNESPELSTALRERNLLWLGDKDWGPFGAGRYTNGLLPWTALQGAPTDTEPDYDPLLEWFTLDSTASAVHLADLRQVPSASLTRSLNYSQPLILLLDRGVTKHRITAWNVRSLANRVAVVDDEQGSRDVDWNEIVEWCRTPRRDEAEEIREISVWDLRDGQACDYSALSEAASAAGISWFRHNQGGPFTTHPRVLKTDMNTSFNVSIPYGSLRAAVSAPTVPLGGDGSALGDFRTVAAAVHVSSLTGQDPRLVARLPDDPRFSDLLQFVSADVLRVSRPTEWGFVAGVSANTSSLNVQLHRKSDVFLRLLGPNKVDIGQSDVGLFQTRAAEMLGGSGGSALTQPGLAAALRLLASRPAGVPLARLRAEIENNRGAWPNTFSNVTSYEYAEGVLRGLLGSGMVRTRLKTKCTYCRAIMQLDPDHVSDNVLCDFCGQEVRLAPIIAWGAPKWVYRLAGHLSEAQVQAMIPALATIGQLSHLPAVHSGSDCSELGLTVSSNGKTVEADIAAYLSSPIPITVIGEVKGRNRVDENDLANLEWLQDKLDSNGFDSLILFATTKDQFGHEETAILQHHCESRAIGLTVRRSSTPRLPLVLTGKELFLPWMHEDNISRWSRDAPALAIHGTALESCKRNLGLDGWSYEGERIRLTWKDPVQN